MPRNPAWHPSERELLTHCSPHYPIGKIRVIYGVRIASFDNRLRGILKQDLWNIIILSNLISCNRK